MADYTAEELHAIQERYRLAMASQEGLDSLLSDLEEAPHKVLAWFYYIELDRIADWIPIAGPFTSMFEANQCRNELDDSHRYRIVIHSSKENIITDGAMLLQLFRERRASLGLS